VLLETILTVTIGTADVGATQRAYSHWLDYETVERGSIPAELAGAWGAPRMTGREFVLMRPASAENIYLRFVQVDRPPGYEPMKTFGWNAVEMLVQDPDRLERKLSAGDSPFRIVGRPRPLGPGSPIRAMQVVGPASEVLYLTRLPADADSPRSAARTEVDRPFIIILGGPRLEDIREFYSRAFGLPVTQPARARMTVLNRAHGLDIETTHPLSIARISPKYALELDGYPQTASARPVADGEIPFAASMVGFEVGSLDTLSLPLKAPARVIHGAPYAGRRVAVVQGPAGELLELVESGHACQAAAADRAERKDPSAVTCR
jgi:hypothetical protein